MASMYVEIDLIDVDDDELIEELESRGYGVNEQTSSKEEDLENIYLLRRTGQVYDHLMDAYIYKILGKII